MEWAFLLVNMALTGLLVHMWLNYLARDTDLRRRQDAASQHAEEHRLELEVTQKEIAAVEALFPELEALAKTLKGEINKVQEQLTKLEMIEGGGHQSRF